MALYFLVGLTSDWSMPPWAQIGIWTPFGILLAREALLGLRPLLTRKTPGEPATIRSLAVGVPTLNESHTLPNCLRSIVAMSRHAAEVIGGEAGATDGTRDVGVRLGASVLHSEPGRGQQIAVGVAKAKADIVLVVHADSEIAPDTADRMLAALNARPQAIGGAVGQRFDDVTPSLCVIEWLNEVK